MPTAHTTEAAAAENTAQPRTTAAARPRGTPALHISGVKSVLNKTESEILPLVETGKLQWVFDVAANPKTARKRELRFLAEEVSEFATGRDSALDWKQVCALLIPHAAPDVTTPEIGHCLNIHETLALRLGMENMRLLSKGKPGFFTPARFERDSFFHFLKGRLAS